jgi:hypothetical protein
LIKCHREKDYGADFYTALAGTIAYIAGGILTLYLQSPIVIFFALSPFGYFAYSILRTMADEITAKTEETNAQIELVKAQTRLTNAQIRKVKVGVQDPVQNVQGNDLNGFERIKKSTPEWLELRQWIWERDNKICKRCQADLSHGYYHCHHILPEYRGGKTEPANLMTICEDCHIELHKVDGQSKGLEKLNDLNAQRQAEKLANLDAVLDYLSQNPNASLADIGRYIGKRKSTAKNYTDELMTAGRLHKNGNGWEVRR